MSNESETRDSTGRRTRSIANPFFARLLLGTARRRHRWPNVHRLVCGFLGSDVFCKIPESLHMPHPYGVVIHSEVVIGEGCTVMHQVTIGQSSSDPNDRRVPTVGSNVFIGAGAKILGPIRIGDGVVVGANSIVTKDVPPSSTVVGANCLLGPSSRRSVAE